MARSELAGRLEQAAVEKQASIDELRAEKTELLSKLEVSKQANINKETSVFRLNEELEKLTSTLKSSEQGLAKERESNKHLLQENELANQKLSSSQETHRQTSGQAVTLQREKEDLQKQLREAGDKE